MIFCLYICISVCAFCTSSGVYVNGERSAGRESFQLCIKETRYVIFTVGSMSVLSVALGHNL